MTLLYQFPIKKGDVRGYDGFKKKKKILGTKLHVAVDGRGLPASIADGAADEHDGTGLVDVVKDVSEHLDDNAMQEIITVYADSIYRKIHQKFLGIIELVVASGTGVIRELFL